MSILKVDEIQDTTGKKILQNTGGVLQVVNATAGASQSTTSSTFVDTTLSASITPTSSTSKILVICQPNIRVYNNSGSDARGDFRILRGSTEVSKFRARCYDYGGSGAILDIGSSLVGLDSPATTSSTTYKMQYAKHQGVAVELNGGGSADDLSTLTLIEISA